MPSKVNGVNTSQARKILTLQDLVVLNLNKLLISHQNSEGKSDTYSEFP